MAGFANRHRGEIEARINGQNYRLCLTLGALAELETAFGETDLLALAERFERGRISANDAILVIGAGLRGAGHTISNDELATMQIDGGAARSLQLVVSLLEATFAPVQNQQGSETDGKKPNQPGKAKALPV